MASISNDSELRAALNTLASEDQRLLGCQFARNVIHLSAEERIRRAIETGLRPNATPGELEDAHKAAKVHAVKTYTDCGKDTDWLAQADHFVAAAAAAALVPETAAGDRQNPAWKAAMQARMAVNCALIESDDAPETSEAEHQYRLTDAFLAGR